MKWIIILLTVVVIACTFVFDSFEISNMILALTGLVILWYTDETQKIRKFNDEQLKLLRKPLVSFMLGMNPNDGKDIQFNISNLSKHPVCCLVKLDAVVFGKKVECPIMHYNGKRYWNVEVSQRKFGHFSWLDILLASGLYPQKEVDGLKEDQNTSQISDKLYEEHVIKANNENEKYIQLELEVFSYNRYGFYEVYPKYYYYIKFNLQRKAYLVSGITSNKPYFDYDQIPDWVDKTKLEVKKLRHEG